MDTCYARTFVITAVSGKGAHHSGKSECFDPLGIDVEVLQTVPHLLAGQRLNAIAQLCLPNTFPHLASR